MDHKRPLISVVVPIYNKEKTLERCVSSILRQTTDDYELILVDDGSTDRRPAIADNYCRLFPLKAHVIHKENGGLISAWRRGFEESQGAFLCFVDSDDWIDEDMLEKMSSWIADRDMPGQIICCGWVFEYEGRKPVLPSPTLPEGEYVGEALEQDIKISIMGREVRLIAYSRCEKLISRELIANNLKYLDERIRLGEDANITIPAMLDASRIVVMHDPFYHYFYDSESMAHGFNRGFYKDCSRLRRRLMQVVRDRGMSEAPVENEFLFLLLQIIKSEIRATGKSDGGKQRITMGRVARRIKRLCEKERISSRLGMLEKRPSLPANRLIAFVCRHPSRLRITLVSAVFALRDLYSARIYSSHILYTPKTASSE